MYELKIIIMTLTTIFKIKSIPGYLDNLLINPLIPPSLKAGPSVQSTSPSSRSGPAAGGSQQQWPRPALHRLDTAGLLFPGAPQLAGGHGECLQHRHGGHECTNEQKF